MPVLFLDRDGTLNVEKNYLHDPDQLELLPGVPEALRRLRQAGYRLVVLTNQSGVGRGFFSIADVEAVHLRLRQLLRAEGVELDAIYYCPHGPADLCPCRKPKTGLALRALADLHLDLVGAAMVGDSPADLALAANLHIPGILVRTGHGRQTEAAAAEQPRLVVEDLREATSWLEASASRPT